MADDLLSDIEGHGSDSKPATKGDEKKSKHLTVVGIIVGLVALYLAYRYYENQKANAAANASTTTAVPSVTTPSSYDGGGGGGGGWSSNGDNGENAQAGQLDQDIQALNSTLMSLAGTSTPSQAGETLVSGLTPAFTGTTVGASTGNETTGPSTLAATSTSTTGAGPSTQPISGLNATPEQANTLVSSNTLTPRAALASEVPASAETSAQRHAQEVANRGLRAQLKS